MRHVPPFQDLVVLPGELIKGSFFYPVCGQFLINGRQPLHKMSVLVFTGQRHEFFLGKTKGIHLLIFSLLSEIYIQNFIYNSKNNLRIIFF